VAPILSRVGASEKTGAVQYYRTVKTILASNADLQPLIEATTPAAYGRARFVRAAAELFDDIGPLH
jgi:hypothetical protein